MDNGLRVRARWVEEFDKAVEECTTKFHKADYAAAKAPLFRAFSLARANNAAGNLAAVQRLAGDIAGAEGRLAEARNLYSAALYNRDELGQESSKPALYEAFGDVQTGLKDYKGAKESLNLCLGGYERFGDPVGVALASRDLGSLAEKTGDLDAADGWLQKGMDELSGRAKPDIENDIRDRQAQVLLCRGRAGEAEHLFRIA